MIHATAGSLKLMNAVFLIFAYFRFYYSYYYFIFLSFGRCVNILLTVCSLHQTFPNEIARHTSRDICITLQQLM